MAKTLLDSSLFIEKLPEIGDEVPDEKDTVNRLVAELKPYLQDAGKDLLSPRAIAVQRILAAV